VNDEVARAALAAADDLIPYLAHVAGCGAVAGGGAPCTCGFVAARRQWVDARTASRRAGL
jgi:hypothetical protein